MPTAGQDDARSSKFSVFFGPFELSPVKVSGLKSERVMVKRPDRTQRVTDQPTPGEFTMVFKMRDRVMLNALKAWRAKREHLDGAVNFLTEDGEIVSIFNVVGACPANFELGELSIEDDATEVVETWTFSFDDVVKIF